VDICTLSERPGGRDLEQLMNLSVLTYLSVFVRTWSTLLERSGLGAPWTYILRLERPGVRDLGQLVNQPYV